MLVADVSGGPGNDLELRTVARAGEPCRLGRGLDRTGTVEAVTAETAAEFADKFVRRARALGTEHILVGATAALREANNGSEVAALIGSRAGLPVRILTGEEEARLVYRAVVAGLGSGAARSSCVAFDIGGGSTEVVSGVGDQAGRWTSLPVGAVNLTERFIRSNPPSASEIQSARESVINAIMHGCAHMPDRTPVLAGVGGTVTVLALMDRGLTSYDPTLLQGWVIERSRLENLAERMLGSTHEERRNLPAMGEGRADIVVAGCLVVSLLIERFPSGGLVCSTQGLRYGLALVAAEEVLSQRGGPNQIH